MSKYIKFVKEPASGEGFDYPRVSMVDPDIYRIVVNESTNQTKLGFGRNPKDVVVFSIYDNETNVIKEKYVKSSEMFDRLTFDFVDYSNTRRTGTISVFNRKFEVTKENHVVLSPTHELKELGETSGSFLIGISLKCEEIGTHESLSKLIVQDISPSRTEIKVIPSSLKTSIRPAELALNNEYLNYFNKKIPISHVFHEIHSFIKSINLKTHINEIINSGYIIEGFHDKVYQLVDFFNFNSIDDFSFECQTLHDEISLLYNNIFLFKYTSVFTEDEFFKEFERCVEYVLEKSTRFANSSGVEYTKYKNLYKDTLLEMYNSEIPAGIYKEKFNSYLSSIMVFDKHEVAVLTTARGNENINHERKHIPLIFKLTNPLPTDIKVGAGFHLNNSIYSDDIIQRVLLYRKSKPRLFKLRNPDLSGLAGQGTQTYTSEQLKHTETEIKRNSLLNLDSSDPGILEKIKNIELEMREEVFGTPQRITEEISNYFNNQTEDYYLTIDYSDFNNFVRYSSARKRLDVFIFKLTKLSNIDRKIEEIRRSWRNSTPEKFSKLSYDSQMAKLSDEKLEILNNLDGYERFLYFEDITELSESAKLIKERVDELKDNIKTSGDDDGAYADEIRSLENQLIYNYVSWPRADFNCDAVDDWEDTVYDYTEGQAVLYDDSVWLVSASANPKPEDIPGQSDMWEFFCKCGECVGKKIPLNHKKYQFLSSRIYYRPMPIPATMEEFSRSSGYTWYAEKAKSADVYDKYNDNSFLNNTPEFIVRDDQNEDYFDFLAFVGHQFDLIHLYVEGIGNIKKPFNNPNKGIPNELVSHMLDYFGGSFEGYDEGGLDGIIRQVRNETQLDYIKRFKEKKHIIWRRILNNLPYILKTIGTEKSIRAMFRCYGVPDYLLRIREFGGIEYNTETNDKVLYTFDHFDYHLVFSKNNQYLTIDWNQGLLGSNAIEFKFSLDDNKCDLFENVVILSGMDDVYSSETGATKTSVDWSFGFHANEVLNESASNVGWGRFYFEINEGESIRREYIKDNGGKEEIYPYEDNEYDVLIQISESDRWSDMGVQIYIKRYIDGEIAYTGQSTISLKKENIEKFLHPSYVVIGNIYASNFYGKLNRLRLYSTPIDEHRFENHIKFNQSYDVSDPFSLEDALMFKANFDFPYDLTGTDTEEYGVIQNSSLRQDVSKFARAYNFDQTNYPYNFNGQNQRQTAQLPSYGAQVFNNNKIRIETQELQTQLSVSKRSTRKSGDLFTIDTNKLGVYFSPSDIINHEILRFFGEFELGDYIGDPRELYNKSYEGFTQVQNLFFKHNFGKVDFSNYLSMLESYLDPSLFKNIEKLIPARTILMSGLLVEPTLLERSKLQRKPIQNEILMYDDIHIKSGLKNKKIVSHGNKRGYYDITDADVSGFPTTLKIKSNRSQTYPTEFGYNQVLNIPNDIMYGVSSYRGISSKYKIETSEKTHKRYTKNTSVSKKYEAVSISGRILKNSEFNCEVYGNTNKVGFEFYVHEDATLNGELIYGNIINKSEYVNGYAILNFNFTGHILSGKVYGIVSFVIQNGFIKNLIVEGRIGGYKFFDCDIKSSSSRFSGNIKHLIDTSILKGTSLKETPRQRKTKLIEVSKSFESSEINSIKIPDKVQHEIELNFHKNIDIKLKNETSKYINARGTYFCRLNMHNSVILTPPPICTFDMSWSRKIKSSQTTNKILNISQSSYDYMHELISSYETDFKNFKSDFELPTLNVKDTTQIFKNVKESSSDECESRNGRYDIIELASIQEGNENTMLETHVGGVKLRKKYIIPTNFTQHLRPSGERFSDDLKLYVNFDNGIFNATIMSGSESIKSIKSEDVPIIGSKTENYFSYSTNTLNVKVNKHSNLQLNDAVFVTNMEWSENLSAFVDFNNQYYRVVDIQNDVTDENKLIKMSPPDHLNKTRSKNSKYIKGGVLYKLPTSIEYTHETDKSVYSLDVSLNYHRDQTEINSPKHPLGGIRPGDRVNVTFREGAFLWITRGIRVIEDAEVLSVSSVSDKTSSLFGEEIIRLEVPEETFGESYVDIIPGADYVYGFEVVVPATSTSNYYVDFKKKFDTQLGPNPSPLSTRKLSTQIDINNKSIVESTFSYYNLADIGNANRKMLNGVLHTHYKFTKSDRGHTDKSMSNLHCRKSVSNLNNTISVDGSPDMTPPIVRTRKAGLRGGMGDTFWYLEDKTYASPLPCGYDGINGDVTPPTESTDTLDLNKKSLELHIDFENIIESDNIVKDNSEKERNGTLHNTQIKTGGFSRNYKKILFLDNNVANSIENTNSYVKFDKNIDEFKLTECTLSFWIRPIGMSADNAGIVVNNSTDNNKRHGVVINPNGNKLSLGYAWTNSNDSHLVDLDVKIPEDSWTHVTFIFYRLGLVSVFVDGVYTNKYDLGVEHDEITFDELEIGRFSGMIDDIRMYSESLTYGDVELGHVAGEYIRGLYESTRVTNSSASVDTDRCGGMPFLDFYDFEYYQERYARDAINWYDEYKHLKDDQTLSPDVRRRMKFEIIGGPNAGDLKYGTTEYMGNLCGIVKEAT